MRWQPITTLVYIILIGASVTPPIHVFAADPEVSYEFLHPLIKTEGESIITGAHFVTVHLSRNKMIQFLIDFPFALVDLGERQVMVGADGLYTATGGSDSGIGNPAIGAIIFSKNPNKYSDFVIRLPLSNPRNRLAAAVGVLSDVSRREAFLPRSLSFSGSWNYEPKRRQGLDFVVRAGASVAADADNPSGGSLEIWTTYRGFVRYTAPAFRLIGGLDGRWAPLEGVGPELNWQNQLALRGEIGDWRIRPAISARVWLEDDIREATSLVLGFEIGYRFGKSETSATDSSR